MVKELSRDVQLLVLKLFSFPSDYLKVIDCKYLKQTYDMLLFTHPVKSHNSTMFEVLQCFLG